MSLYHRKISGWGRYPTADAEVFEPVNEQAILEEITSGADTDVVPRGLGRSYGDSALAGRVISTRHLDYLHSFDPDNGVLTCSAGVSLAELIAFSIPRGWFLPVTPGTKFVTVGGAVASDVHGKNHHLDGSFGNHVRALGMFIREGCIYIDIQDYRHLALNESHQAIVVFRHKLNGRWRYR